MPQYCRGDKDRAAIRRTSIQDEKEMESKICRDTHPHGPSVAQTSADVNLLYTFGIVHGQNNLTSVPTYT